MFVGLIENSIKHDLKKGIDIFRKLKMKELQKTRHLLNLKYFLMIA